MPLSRNFRAALLASILPTLIAGCGGSGGGGTTATPVSGGASTIYALQQTSTTSTVLIFPAAGAANPMGTLTTPSGTYAESIATDASGLIYVGVQTAAGGGQVLVYAAGATGAATPIRTLTGAVAGNASVTTFTTPYSMVVGANGMLYIASAANSAATAYTIAAFPATASGSPTPSAFNTSPVLTNVFSVAADPSGNTYVSNGSSTNAGSIYVFASGATGNATPSRTITNSNLFYGVAVDSSANIYAALDNANGNAAGALVEYAAGASGAAIPTRTISGAATTFYFGGGVRVDSVGNLYAVNLYFNSANVEAFSLLKFSPTASGNVVPTVNISSTAYNSPGSELAVY